MGSAMERSAGKEQVVLTQEERGDCGTGSQNQVQVDSGLGEWTAGMSEQEISEWIGEWWHDQVANREAYHQMRMRNQERLIKVLTREPDWEGLKEGYKIVEELRQEAKTAGIEDMSMEEVDAIIAECRREMCQEQK